MVVPVSIADEASGEGWKALIFPSKITLAVDPLGENLPRALRELLTPGDMEHWLSDWAFEDQAGWDVYHVERIHKVG